ncbi:MAG: methyltransferase [Nitrospinae bacterium]|nr:methyltransferase [Nitrospinota bacterium]
MNSDSLQLGQETSGYRYNRDSFMLADFFDPSSVESLLDAGAGVGVVSILIGKAHPSMKITALEINPHVAATALANARKNGLSRYHVVAGDVMGSVNLFGKHKFDAVVSNPPYRKAGTGRLNADPVKAVARHELRMTLDGLVKVSSAILKQGGSLTLTMIWERRDEYISALSRYGFHEKRFRKARSFDDSPPLWFLSEARFNVKTETVETPPLTLKSADGGDSPEFMRIMASLTGRALEVDVR